MGGRAWLVGGNSRRGDGGLFRRHQLGDLFSRQFAARSQELFRECDDPVFHAGRPHLGEGGLDVILDTFQRDLSVGDDGVGSAGVTVPRLPDAAGLMTRRSSAARSNCTWE